MALTLGNKQRCKADVQKSVITKLKRIDNQDALEILDKLLDKPGMDKRLVKNKFFILNF